MQKNLPKNSRPTDGAATLKGLRSMDAGQFVMWHHPFRQTDR